MKWQQVLALLVLGIYLLAWHDARSGSPEDRELFAQLQGIGLAAFAYLIAEPVVRERIERKRRRRQEDDDDE